MSELQRGSHPESAKGKWKNYKSSCKYISIYIGASMSGLVRKRKLEPQKTYLGTVSVELKKCEGNKEEEKP